MTGRRGRGQKRFLRGASSDPTGVGRITGIGEKASAVPLIGTAALALTADVKVGREQARGLGRDLTATSAPARCDESLTGLFSD